MGTLLGTWLLVDARAFDADETELEPPLGPDPIGIITYEAERMIVAVARATAPALFSGYAGRYTFDGEILTVMVDAASDPTAPLEQVRRISFDGPDRYVAMPTMRVLGHDAGLRLTWRRAG